ncbi:hypothetical protein BpHYR1_037316 [Brachionus plicatilis]|uniref:Uncharacterized protein n=1 Tax=Brachionus plicatilis TaxID=10195 RepID=A0A3M7RYL5_BRAPC|nr:hypothetical protein BpHYR1_037316 [Brachionus plicatilis]
MKMSKIFTLPRILFTDHWFQQKIVDVVLWQKETSSAKSVLIGLSLIKHGNKKICDGKVAW